MTTHFNGLTPAEAERLAYLIEECSEVIKCATKILRHGYDSHNPDRPGDGSNRNQISREIADVSNATNLMYAARDIRPPSEAINAGKWKRYMHHQEAP